MIKRKGFVLLICTLMVVFLYTSCMGDQKSSTVLSDAVSAATDYTHIVSKSVEVTAIPLRDRVTGSGIIQSQKEAIVRSRVPGTITDISFSLGSQVRKGEPLILLDDSVAQLSVSQLENQFANSVKDYEASLLLYERGAISLSQLQQSKSLRDGLEAQLKNSKDSLNSTSIVSPITGSVAEKNMQLVIGDLIQAGQSIAKVIDLEKLRVALPLGQSQVFLVRPGYEAEIKISTPMGTFTAAAEVSAVSASSDSRTGSWTALIDFDNPQPDIIKAGVVAQVTIFNRDAPTYEVVPNAAMVYRNRGTFVYVYEQNRANLVEVTIIDQYGDFTAVEPVDTSITLLGAKVLVSGLSRIEEGLSVVTQTN